VAESRISDYEHARHQPSVAMLQRLLDATGCELIARKRRRVDVQRNARVFADLLSLVDAVPFSEIHEHSARTRPLPNLGRPAERAPGGRLSQKLSLADRILVLHDALEGARIEHGFGGAIALAYYVEEPRATRDIDVNLAIGTTGRT
jgi:transcriptional regulator with XRE-family HTH domain